jgi:hypothetical protein
VGSLREKAAELGVQRSFQPDADGTGREVAVWLLGHDASDLPSVGLGGSMQESEHHEPERKITLREIGSIHVPTRLMRRMPSIATSSLAASIWHGAHRGVTAVSTLFLGSANSVQLRS